MKNVLKELLIKALRSNLITDLIALTVSVLIVQYFIAK